MTDATPTARPARRERSATASLLSIVLVLEAVLVFFVSLTVFGLDVLRPAVALGGGAGAIVVLVAAAATTSRPWGVWLGWALQAALVATGLLLPLMFAVGAGFVALWLFCFVRGRQLDRAKAEYLASTGAADPSDREASESTNKESPS